MLLDFALPEHERKLIPEGRVSGPMPWVIAIMLFLTLLAATAGLFLINAAQQGGDDIGRRVTVQIIEPNPAVRASQRAAITKSLRDISDIEMVRAVPDKEVHELLSPWLGDDVNDADIPVPALVEVTFRQPPDDGRMAELKKQITVHAKNSRLDSHASWMAPYFRLMQALILLAGGVLLLLLVATAATVVLAVRSALNTHRETIEIMHMMGGTDLQAARLFQRRVALDCLLGSFIGFVAAAITYWFISVLSIIPLAVTYLAMLMARWTVMSALRKML